jgi:DNA-binding NarL/FixJ family response regulator
MQVGMMEDNLIQVAIFARTLAVRVGFRTLLGASQSIQIVAEAADPAGLEDAWWDIDVVLLQGQESLEGIEPLLSSETQLGLLWINDDLKAAQALRGLPLSAWGLLSSEASSEELIAAVHAIHQGLIVAPRVQLDSLWGKIHTARWMNSLSSSHRARLKFWNCWRKGWPTSRSPWIWKSASTLSSFTFRRFTLN